MFYVVGESVMFNACW